MGRGGARPGWWGRMLRQDGRLGPGVAVPPALPRAAGRVRVPPRRRAGVAAVLAHPPILPKGRLGAGTRSLGRVRIFVAGGTGAIGRPLVQCPRRGRARRHRVLPQRGEDRRPGCPRRRAGGRRCLRRRQGDTRRGGGETRGAGQPVDQPGPVRQSLGGEARVRHDQPPAARGLGHAGHRRPLRRCPPCHRPEHLVCLPPGSRDADRVRPAVDRRPWADRQAHGIPRRSRVGHARRRRRRGCRAALRVLLRPGHLLRARRPLRLHDRQAPPADSRRRRRALRPRAHRRRGSRHRGRAGGSGRRVQRRRRRARPGVRMDALRGRTARRQATAPRAGSGGRASGPGSS